MHFLTYAGLFAAMIVSLLTTELYRVLIQKKFGLIRMPEERTRQLWQILLKHWYCDNHVYIDNAFRPCNY